MCRGETRGANVERWRERNKKQENWSKRMETMNREMGCQIY
jgi:hypothetical protein